MISAITTVVVRRIDHDAFSVYIAAKRKIDLCFCPCHKGFVGNADHILGNDRGHASRKEHAGQGYNEWLNVHISYKKSLHKSKYDSGYQHDQNCGNRADLCPLPSPGQQHAGHGNEGTNADINAAGDHNGGHADTDHDQACVGNKQV